MCYELKTNNGCSEAVIDDNCGISKFYAIATAFSIITTYFAGYLPARKASKIDPVIIIRGK